jgi:RNA polymerase sigma factor (sigma-70 family)
MQAGADLDAALIDASRSGDRTAFAQIIERYHRAVYAVSFSSVRDRTLADDITQDTFVTAWRRFGDLRDATKLPAWLCGIARNLGRDARKRMRRETIGEPVEPIDATTPYEALSEAESERLVAVALGQIPDVYREPLVLYYYEERSVDDVARSLGISAATTNKRLSRGRQYLAERVATIVEGAIVRRGPSAALVASVLAVIGTVAPAHVDASPVKGSTMNKLGIAAAVTAAVGGVVLIVAVPSDGGAANAKARSIAGATASEKSATAKSATGHTSESCATDMMRALSAPKAPSLTATSSTSATATNDCGAVGRHLAELEGDATHGPDHRPDEATCEACAGVYTQRCESGGWSVERRNCTLAASDLFNAHLCAGTSTPTPAPAEIPAALSCATLGQQITTTVKTGGLYTEMPDMAVQIEAACQLGDWPLALRQCLAAATNVDALQACVAPPAP